MNNNTDRDKDTVRSYFKRDADSMVSQAEREHDHQEQNFGNSQQSHGQADASAVRLGTSALNPNAAEFHVAGAEFGGKPSQSSGHSGHHKDGGTHSLSAQGNSGSATGTYYGLSPTFFKRELATSGHSGVASGGHGTTLGGRSAHASESHGSDPYHQHHASGASASAAHGQHASSHATHHHAAPTSGGTLPHHELTPADYATASGAIAAAGTGAKLGTASAPVALPAHGLSAAPAGHATRETSHHDSHGHVAGTGSHHESEHLSALYHPLHQAALYHGTGIPSSEQHGHSNPAHGAAVAAAFGGAGMLPHQSSGTAAPSVVPTHGLSNAIPLHHEPATFSQNAPAAHLGSSAHQPLQGPGAIAAAANRHVGSHHEQQQSSAPQQLHHSDNHPMHIETIHQPYHGQTVNAQGLPVASQYLEPVHTTFPSSQNSGSTGSTPAHTSSHPQSSNQGNYTTSAYGLGSAAALAAGAGAVGAAAAHQHAHHQQGSSQSAAPVSVHPQRGSALSGPSSHSFSPSQDRPVHVPETKSKGSTSTTKQKGHYLTHASSFSKKKNSVGPAPQKVLPSFIPPNMRRPHAPPPRATVLAPSVAAARVAGSGTLHSGSNGPLSNSLAVVASGPVHDIFIPRPTDGLTVAQAHAHAPKIHTGPQAAVGSTSAAHTSAAPLHVYGSHAAPAHASASAHIASTQANPVHINASSQGLGPAEFGSAASASVFGAAVGAMEAVEVDRHYDHHPQQPHLTHKISSDHQTPHHQEQNPTLTTSTTAAHLSSQPEHLGHINAPSAPPVVTAAQATPSAFNAPVVASAVNPAGQSSISGAKVDAHHSGANVPREKTEVGHDNSHQLEATTGFNKTAAVAAAGGVGAAAGIAAALRSKAPVSHNEHHASTTTGPVDSTAASAPHSISDRHVEPISHMAEAPVVYVTDRATSTMGGELKSTSAAPGTSHAVPATSASVPTTSNVDATTHTTVDDKDNHTPVVHVAEKNKDHKAGPLAAAAAAIGAGAAAVRSAIKHEDKGNDHQANVEATEKAKVAEEAMEPHATTSADAIKTSTAPVTSKVEEKTFVGLAAADVAAQVPHKAGEDVVMLKTTTSKSSKKAAKKAQKKALEKAQAEAKAAEKDATHSSVAAASSTSNVPEKTTYVTKESETIAAAVPTAAATAAHSVPVAATAAHSVPVAATTVHEEEIIKKDGKEVVHVETTAKEKLDAHPATTTATTEEHAHGTGAKIVGKMAAAGAAATAAMGAVAHKLRHPSVDATTHEKTTTSTATSKDPVHGTETKETTTTTTSTSEVPVVEAAGISAASTSTSAPAKPVEQVTTDKLFIGKASEEVASHIPHEADEEVVMLKTTTTTALVPPVVEPEVATEKVEVTTTKVEKKEKKVKKERKPLNLSGKITTATAATVAAATSATAAYKSRQPDLKKPVLLVKEEDVEKLPEIKVAKRTFGVTEDDIKKPTVPVVSHRLTVSEDDVFKPTVPVVSHRLTVTEDDVYKPTVDFEKIGHPVLKLSEDDVVKPDPTNAPHPVIPPKHDKGYSIRANRIAKAARPMIPLVPVQGKDIKFPKVTVPKVSMPTIPKVTMPKMKMRMPKMLKRKGKVAPVDHIKSVTTTTRTIVDPPVIAAAVAAPAVVESVRTHVVEEVHDPPPPPPMPVVVETPEPVEVEVPKPVVVEAPKPVVVEAVKHVEIAPPKPVVVAAVAAPIMAAAVHHTPAVVAPPAPVPVVVHEMFSTNAEQVPSGYTGLVPKVSDGDTLLWVKKIQTKQEFYDSEEEDDQQLDELGYRKDRDVSRQFSLRNQSQGTGRRGGGGGSQKRVDYHLGNHTRPDQPQQQQQLPPQQQQYQQQLYQQQQYQQQQYQQQQYQKQPYQQQQYQQQQLPQHFQISQQQTQHPTGNMGYNTQPRQSGF